MPTVRFILQVDELFDALNSKNPIAQGSKAPISQKNHDGVVARLICILSYLASLTTESDQNIRSTGRWLSVVGVTVTVLSLIRLLPELLTKQCYVLTYKFSQDHLELLFCSVRRLGGWNNSPTAQQFSKIWRQLIRRAGVKAGPNGNVRALDSTCLITVGHRDFSEEARSAEPAEIADSDTLLLLMDSVEEDPSNTMTPLVKNACCYIAGWTVKRAEEILTCTTCVAALTTSSPPSDMTEHYCLIGKKDYAKGALKMPSKAVLETAMATERAIRASGDARVGPATLQRISTAVVKAVGSDDLFGLQDHDRDTLYGIDRHSLSLIRTIVSLYYRVRQHHIARLRTQRLQAGNRRKVLNKVTLFRGH